MIALATGWGVFWLLVWVFGLVLGVTAKADGLTGLSFIMTVVSLAWLMAVGIVAVLL